MVDYVKVVGTSALILLIGGPMVWANFDNKRRAEEREARLQAAEQAAIVRYNEIVGADDRVEREIELIRFYFKDEASRAAYRERHGVRIKDLMIALAADGYLNRIPQNYLLNVANGYCEHSVRASGETGDRSSDVYRIYWEFVGATWDSPNIQTQYADCTAKINAAIASHELKQRPPAEQLGRVVGEAQSGISEAVSETVAPISNAWESLKSDFQRGMEQAR